MPPYGTAAPSVLGEIREMLLSPRTAAGILPRSQAWRALLWGAGLGTLGVMTGYAAFVAWMAEEHHDWQVLLVVVVVVAAIAAIGEQARHIIAHGAGEPQKGGLLARVVSILAGFVIVLLFEVANTAWHKGGEKLHETLEDMLGLAFEPTERRIRLLTIVLVWIASGAVVAMVLVRRILSMKPHALSHASAASARTDSWTAPAPNLLIRIWRSRALRGGITAAFMAGGVCALLLLAVVMAAEGLRSLYLLVTAYGFWLEKVQALSNTPGAISYLAYPALWLDGLLNSWFMPLLRRAWWVFAFGLGALWWHFSWARAVITLAILAIFFVPPVGASLPDLIRLALLYALVWAIPAFVLGAASPHLREYKPTRWGQIACLAALCLGLLAVLQGAVAAHEIQQATAACAGITMLIGLLLIFAPPTRDYLPLIAVVCGLLSYAAANALAFPTHIMERVVFLNASSVKPKPLDAAALAPPSGFVMPWDGGDWEISKEVYGRLQRIAALERKHERWQRSHELLPYLSYLGDPKQYLGLTRAYRFLLRENIPERHLFEPPAEGLGGTRGVKEECAALCPPGTPLADCALKRPECVQFTPAPPKRALCPRNSRMECLAALADPAKVPGADTLGWTLPTLQSWVTRVSAALESDLRLRWADQATGLKMHVALSTAIGFFLALAALIGWQIRNAHEALAK